MNQAISLPSVSTDRARKAEYEHAYQSSNDPWDYASSFDQVRFTTISSAAKRWYPAPKNSLETTLGGLRAIGRLRGVNGSIYFVVVAQVGGSDAN
jgi:hypothetical protein